METSTGFENRWCRTLLGVWAHPDDEAYLSAGLMGRVSDAGGRVVCVHATFGERGTDNPHEWPPERLGAARAHELSASLAVVGAHGSITFGYADGRLDEVDPARARDDLVGIIAAVRPDVIVTFGPDGMTGHPDHKAVWRWTTAAWRSARSRAELLYATTTASFADRHREMYEELALVGEPGLPVRTPLDQVALDVELSERELDRKRTALAAHASQTTLLARRMGEPRYRYWFDHETFRHPTQDDLRAVLGHRVAA